MKKLVLKWTFVEIYYTYTPLGGAHAKYGSNNVFIKRQYDVKVTHSIDVR